eukprot:169633-Pelagomonas_calceolata.AAC.1
MAGYCPLVATVPRSPRHVHLDLSQLIARNVNRLRLRAHTLKVETAAWDTWNFLLCNRCSRDEIQDEVHALLICRDADVCALRRKYACLFNCFSGDISTEQPYLQQGSVQALMDRPCDIMLTGKDQSQADQPNTLAGGPPRVNLDLRKKERLRLPILAAHIKEKSPERQGPTTQTKRK